MSDYPVSLRNIAPEILQVAQCLSRRNGLSVADVLRLALLSGVLVEVAKAGPDQYGLYAGLDVAYLAKSLRRHLATPIDLLLEQGEHPYQGSFTAPASASTLPAPGSPPRVSTDPMMFDPGLGDDLETLGMGVSLSAGLVEEPAIS